MKTLLRIAALAGITSLAFAQSDPAEFRFRTGSTTTVTWPNLTPPVPVKSARYLVEYATTEKCFECTTRYAIWCSPDAPGCGVPTKEVHRFEPFESREDALAWMNTRMQGRFVRLLRVSEVAVEVTKKTTEIPQPVKVMETTEYAVKK